MCSKLGVGYLQASWTLSGRLCAHADEVGSNDEPDATAGFNKTVEDMTWLAELGAKHSPPVKISYEPWCFLASQTRLGGVLGDPQGFGELIVLV